MVHQHMMKEESDIGIVLIYDGHYVDVKRCQENTH